VAGPARQGGLIVDAVLPALDEERSLPPVLEALRHKVRRAIVVDNGSRDRTAEVARRSGAEVVVEPRRGYGAACLAGIARLAADPPDVVAFLDADGSDDPDELPSLLGPIARGEADLVLGSRTLGPREPGSLSLQQRAGNALATGLIAHLFKHRYSDLGPFRAIVFEKMRDLGMRDRGYGWTVEMQVRALRSGLRVVEVPVRYRRRTAGRSKVSRTLRGTVGAGATILWTIARHAIF